MSEINVLMLGGKRCGKTTVLASMCNEIGKVIAGTNMSFNISDDSTRARLEKAIENISEKIGVFETPLKRTVVDDNQTDSWKTYSFRVRVGNRAISFKIHDIPGEWLTDTHQDNVKWLINISQVIMIAIDTPYLFAKMMDDKGYGKYHEEYNKPAEITNFFKNSLTTDEISGRMILFVPIKCERYYHLTHTTQLNAFNRDYMQELAEAVFCGYGELMHYLRSTQELVQNCSVAITPILSAGGIDFVRFYEDEETKRIVSLYQEAEFLEPYEKGYTPKFCEQPLLYSMVYTLSCELENIKTGKLRFFSDVSATQLTDTRETLRRKLKKGTGNQTDDGFIILQDYMQRL